MGNRIQHETLVADTITTIDLDDNYRSVEVINVDGVAAVYVTVDDKDPAVEGDGCEVLPAAIGSIEIDSPQSGPNGVTRVKLISSGIPKVTVVGLVDRGYSDDN